MKVIITYDRRENLFNCWIDGKPTVQGFGFTKKSALGDLFLQLKDIEIIDWAYSTSAITDNKRLSKCLR